MSKHNLDDSKYFIFDSIINHKDIDIFEQIINTSYQFELLPMFEKMMAKVIDKKTKEEKKVSMIPIGIYWKKDKTFEWLPNVLEHLFIHLLLKIQRFMKYFIIQKNY